MSAKQTFEKAMAQLEKIVQALESEELTLDNAIKKFEEGTQLSQFCLQKLDDSEKKINMLLKQADGSIVTKPLDTDQ